MDGIKMGQEVTWRGGSGTRRFGMVLGEKVAGGHIHVLVTDEDPHRMIWVEREKLQTRDAWLDR